jgi:hypothetical protein
VTPSRPRSPAPTNDEAAQSACRPTSPDRADYLALKARGLTHTRASLTIARKLARRCFHTLRNSAPTPWSPSAEASADGSAKLTSSR